MADRSVRSSRRAHRQVLAISLVASALIHALVLLLPIELDRPDRPRRRAVPGPRETPFGSLEVVHPGHAAEAAPSSNQRPSVPAALPDTLSPSVTEPAPPADEEMIRRSPGSGRGPEPPPPSAAELFRPRLSDPDLWQGEDSHSPPLSGLGSLADAIAAFNRKMAGVHIPPAGDMNVWTGRDGDDNRWGISPGAIHLGTVTIPLCSGRFDAANCGFGVAPLSRDAYRLQVRQRLEIGSQIDRGDLLDRAKAIRARRDAQRDSVPGRRR